ncbi:MAG: hypothetical protein WCK43_02850 [bacterium]
MSLSSKKTTTLFLLSILLGSSFLFAGKDEGGSDESKSVVSKKSKSKVTLPATLLAPQRAGFYRSSQNEKSKISIEYKVELAFQNFFRLIKETSIPSLTCVSVDNNLEKPTLELQFFSPKINDLVTVSDRVYERNSDKKNKYKLSTQNIHLICDGIEQIKALSPSEAQDEANSGGLFDLKVEYPSNPNETFKSIEFSTEAPRTTASTKKK